MLNSWLFAFILYALIVIPCIIFLISPYIEPLNTLLFDFRARIYNFNDYEIIKEKLKNFNIKIYNNNEIEENFINISKTLIENITIEKYYKLLQKEFLLLKILNKEFEGNSTLINDMEIKKIYNYDTQSFNNSNKIIFSFYKGLNESSKKDILILQKKDIFSKNIEYFISYLDNNLIIDLNNETNLFNVNLSVKLLYNNKIKNINKYNGTIEIISKLDYYNLTLNQNNINISSINISDYKLLIIYQNFKSILISSKNNNYSNSTYLNITKHKEANSFNNKNYTKINSILFNLLLILFSIINIIFIKKFINENYFIHAISVELVLLNKMVHINNILSFSFFPFLKNILYSEKSIFKKLFCLTSQFFAIINIVYQYKFFSKIIEKLIDEADSALPFFRFIPNVILLIFNKYNIDLYLMWFFQICNNIIFNNKYTLPLSYIIFLTLDKLLYIRNNDSFTIYRYLIFTSFSIFSIIIIYLQALLGPRFMLNSKYEENNEKYYLSKKELIKEKPKSIYEICPICLIPIFDKSKIKKNNGDNTDNILMKAINKAISEIKDDINICKEFMKRIIKNGLFDFYEYDFKLLKKYMLIPCGHFFHSSCLEKWIEVENNCPLCRKNIPNLN